MWLCQIAAMNPLAVDESSIAPETIAREREIAIEQIKAEGKPAEMAEKIAVGKVNKFLKDNTLVHQPFVKDNGKSVADYLKSIDADLKVVEFKKSSIRIIYLSKNSKRAKPWFRSFTFINYQRDKYYLPLPIVPFLLQKEQRSSYVRLQLHL